MNTQETLEISILCRNRPDSLRRLLNSLLMQTKSNCPIKISDNSSIVNIYSVYAEYKDKLNIRYVRRENLTFSDHFNINVDEANQKYICLLHDDDILHKNYIETLLSYLFALKDTRFSGIAPNGVLFEDQTLNFKGVFNINRKIIKLCNSLDLYKNYFWLGRTGINPFPSYVYNVEYLSAIRYVPQCGKYSDLSLIDRMISVAPIIWIPEKLLYYCIHDSNDSGVISDSDLSDLDLYFNTKIKDKFIYKLYRLDMKYIKYPSTIDHALGRLFRVFWISMLFIRPALYRYIFKKILISNYFRTIYPHDKKILLEFYK